MRTVVAILLGLLMIGGNLEAAGPALSRVMAPRGGAPTVFTAESIHGLRFSGTPTSVNGRIAPAGDAHTMMWGWGGDSNPPTPVTASAGLPKYKTGSGVVLGPGRWLDAETKSTLGAAYALVNDTQAQMISSASPTSYVQFRAPQGTLTSSGLLWAYFAGLPSATHTYVLTLGLAPNADTSGGSLSNIAVWLGNYDRHPGSSLVVNGNAARIIFTYTPDLYDSSYSLRVFVDHNSAKELDPTFFQFYYIQLVQLD